MSKHQLITDSRLALPFFILWFMFSTLAFTGMAKLSAENNLELSIIIGFSITMLVVALSSVLRSEVLRMTRRR